MATKTTIPEKTTGSTLTAVEFNELNDNFNDVVDDVNVTNDSKATPVDADKISLWDSVAAALKSLTWANLKATLKTYFDTLYAGVLGADDNYVTDAEKTVIGNTSGTNTGDQSANDFNHDDLSNISGSAGEYNHPTDAQMTVLGNTSGTNTGDQSAGDFSHNSLAGLNDGDDYEHITQTQKNKLDGIEDWADVTDATNVNAVESDPIVGAVSGIVKADGGGNISAAVENSDYQGVLAEGAFVDGDKTKLNNQSGTNTGDEDAASIATINHGTDAKSALVDADEINGQNSENSFSLIRTTWTNVKAFLKTYFDTLYNAVLSSDINAALTGAASPAAGNVFATIDDVPTDVNELADEDNSITYEVIGVACSDESTDLETGEAVAFDMPYGFTVTRVYCSVVTAPVSSAIQVDVEDEGTTILNAVVSIAASANNGETSTFTGSASSYAFSKGDLISFDIDQIGSSTAGAGLKVFLEGYRT